MESPGHEAQDAATTFHVRRAIGGDAPSLEWIVKRFSPLVQAQAAYRLGPAMSRRIDLEDVVADAWLALMPRLEALSPRDDRYTPVMLSYLCITTRRLANRRLQAHVRRTRVERELDHGETSSGADPIQKLGVQLRGAVTEAVHGEMAAAITECLARLDEPSREVLILRGIEGRTTQEIADELNLTPEVIRQRYHRAVKKVRASLPGSVFDELRDP